jgi:hypothetical protein
MRLLDHHPQAEQQARREGEALLDLMHRSGVGTGREWRTAGKLGER